ncbi:MAG: RNA polymerase sigma factor [Oscillospiraceae bacterium]|nr:RNA polymerase sigma factor [Oscillospiraceae bacterium]
MDDARIVDLFLAKDESALAYAGEKYGKRLLALARGILGDQGAAEECVNDAWLEAWNRIPPHEPRDYLFPFLAKIVRARALNCVKALSAEKRSAEIVALTDELAEILHSDQDTEAAVEARALSEAVSRWLWSVSEEKRQVFVRRYWYAEPLRQIAARYGMSEAKVKSLLLRTRQELAKQLTKEGYDL